MPLFAQPVMNRDPRKELTILQEDRCIVAFYFT